MDLVIPAAESDVSDARLLDLYGRPEGTWLRMSFVESLDGAVSADGRSAGLQPEGDTRVFRLLRRLSDVVLVASGTVRAESYGALRLSEQSVAWRRQNGLPDHPVVAIVSGRLDLDPASDLFATAPVRPLVVTTGSSPVAARAALADVADVVVAGESALDVCRVREELAARGLRQILCEGGPGLAGTLIEGDAVDELCLTLSPLLLAGGADRIARSGKEHPTRLRLAHALREEDALFLSYRRPS